MKAARKSIVTMLAAAGFVALSTAAYAFPPGAGPCGYGGGPGMGRWGGGPGPMMGGGGPGFRGGPGAGPRAGYGPGPGAGPAVNAQARLDYLKGELKITDSQQAAWDAFATKTKEQTGAMLAMRTQMASTAAQTGPERLAQRAEFAKQRAAAMESRSTALKDLYAALTPEQKTVADQHFGGWQVAQGGPRGGYGPGMMRGYGPRW